MKGCGPIHKPALKKPPPTKPWFFRPMPERAEPISARNEEQMGPMREPCPALGALSRAPKPRIVDLRELAFGGSRLSW
jgi:hypothetical protein